ncbi:MAG: hypothetical protein ABIA93_05060 [Candidatus Woesearchaeota archaeon]
MGDKLRRVKLGYEIANEALERVISNADSLPDSIHVQRIESFSEAQNPWEALGYIGAIGKTFLKHPCEVIGLYLKR